MCIASVLRLYYTSTMKRVISLRISEEAIAILDKQENKSSFIESLLLEPRVPQAPATGGLTKEEVLDLIKYAQQTTVLSQGSGSPFVPSAPDPITGYPCCQKKAPCKHWTFDGAESHWKNELTGKTMEVL